MKKKRFHIDFAEHGIVYALIIFWVILALTNENFRGITFYQNILRMASFNAICGIGMTYAIISGDFDLSVASQVAVSSVVLTLILPTWGIIPSIFFVLLLGVGMGLVNGILIAKMKIPAFITTLATQLGYRALAQLINNDPVVVSNDLFKSIALQRVGFMPLSFIIMAVLAILGTVILRWTKLGRHILAIGNSHKAAEISGINIAFTQIKIFVLVGLFTAMSSIMITSYLGSSNYGMQNGLEFTIISSVVLGGTALAGGKGSIFNTVVAAIFLVSIKSAMDAWGLGSYWQRIVEGGILVFAFSITQIRTMIKDMMVRYNSRKQLKERLSSQA